MRPRSTSTQKPHDGLKCRSVRAALDLERLRERSIIGDDEVLQADSGTRTASIKGGSVATAKAIRQWLECEAIKHNPIRHYVAAISVGIVDGTPTLDLRFKEDSRLQVDMNVVMTSNLEFAEVQATAEGRTNTW